MSSEDNEVLSNDNKSFIFEKSPNDNNSEKAKINFSNNFICKRRAIGSLLYKSENLPKSSQFIIPKEKMFNDSLRFQIISPQYVELEKDNTELVSIVLKIHNVSKKILHNLNVTTIDLTRKNNFINAIWVGNTSYIFDIIKPNQILEPEFQLVVVSPGIFNISSFEITCENEKIILPFSHLLCVSM